MAPPGSSGQSKLSKLRSILNPLTWKARLELDSWTFLLMLKGALPPTIVIAIHQSNAIADITLTIGYLSALISVLSQALMPRAKFMKIMFFDLLATCVSASLCCLAVFCAVEARKHNTPVDASESVRNGFSSDACAVSAIWLIFMIWGANTLRALRPMELQDPMVAFSIFCSVTITRGGTFVTLSDGLAFIARLLKGFMLGFAIATGVSLLIVPITSRGDVFHDVRTYVAQIEGLLGAQIEFVVGSSEAWMAGGGRGLLNRTRTARSLREVEREGMDGLEGMQKRLAEGMTRLNALHGKLQTDLFYSTDELVWGKLSAEDLNRLGALMRGLLLPLSGMVMLPEILEMIVNDEGARGSSGDALEDEEDVEDQALKHSEIERVVQTLHDRLVESSSLTTTGLQYVLLALELIKPKQLERQRQARSDEESRSSGLNPLEPDFTGRFEQQLREYYASRKHLPRALASLEAFSVSEKASDYTSDNPRTLAADPDVRQEFFLILYMGHLQETLLTGTLDLIKFADRKIADGTMKRNRLIFPKQNSIRAWLSLNPEKKEPKPDSTPNRRPSAQPSPFPDPEHLPPTNLFEKSSTILRVISHVIRSEQSLFGFRVAAASFSVGILAFLHQTQDFFIHQRCIWAMIVIVIGMNPTSGQTLFGFMARIAATAISLVLSLVVWYIVDQKTAGVIVFLYLANVFEYYFYIKTPQYFGAAVISIVTLNVIIGYELQVCALGLETATSNGQPYYPIYLFGPYKLAAVAAGCAISFVWVIFPYPITAKSTLRRALGKGLFVLAKFYSCMHASVEMWLVREVRREDDGEDEDENGRRHATALALETARHKVFKEEMMLLNQLRMHSHFSTFEPAIGGKFPKEVYDGIIAEMQRMVNCLALMAHTTQSLDALAVQSRSPQTNDTDDNNELHPEPSPEKDNKKWTSRLATIALHSPNFTSHATTSLLCHLSAALTSAQPLPPYLAPSTGDSFPLARELQKIDGEMLSIRHVEDPAFSAFVALEVLRSVVGFGLRGLLRDVKGLVGELSFDFQLRRSSDCAESTRLMSDRDSQGR